MRSSFQEVPSKGFSSLFHEREEKIVATLCAIELYRIFVDGKDIFYAAKRYLSPITRDLDSSEARIAVISTAISFFWRALRTGYNICPVQLLAVCVKLAHASLELDSLSDTEMRSLHSSLYVAMSARLSTEDFVHMLGSSCSNNFAENLSFLEIEIIEKLGFKLIACCFSGQLRSRSVKNSRHKPFMNRLQAVVLCFCLVKQSLGCDSYTLTLYAEYITTLSYDWEDKLNTEKSVMSDDFKLIDELQLLLADVYTLLQLSSCESSGTAVHES